eukprot:37771_1
MRSRKNNTTGKNNFLFLLFCFRNYLPFIWSMTFLNSSKETSPSRSSSASAIISWRTSSPGFSPRSLATSFRLAKETFPFLSKSKSWKALRISSGESFWAILDFIIFSNSWYSMRPLSSVSMDLIIFSISSRGWSPKPRPFMAKAISSASMAPEPSASKRLNASLICSSVRAAIFVFGRSSCFFNKVQKL